MGELAPVLSYLQSTAFDEAAGRGRTAPRWPFVTVSRQAGAGGGALAAAIIARTAAEKGELWRDWRLIDREVCEAVARVPKLSVGLETLADEKFTGPWADYLTQLFADASPQLLVLKHVFRLLRAAGAAGRVVLLGRAANLVTRDLPLGIHVRLVASQKARVGRVIEAQGLDRRSAAARVAELDASRRRLVRDYFQRDIDDPALYDAVFDTEHLTIDEIAQLVVEMVRQKARRLELAGAAAKA